MNYLNQFQNILIRIFIMLDIKWIVENPEEHDRRMARRGHGANHDFCSKTLIRWHDHVIEWRKIVEGAYKNVKDAQKTMTEMMKNKNTIYDDWYLDEIKDCLKSCKESLVSHKEDLKLREDYFNHIMSHIPNYLDESVHGGVQKAA